ncbi:MAG: hypothetical protein HZA95_00655 [Candidatus Vogelbacteria bacterium]|nr:hypothetical protein [Candidatus Vogelbacteria bacterium]
MFEYLKSSYFYCIIDPVKWWKRYWAAIGWLQTNLYQGIKWVVMAIPKAIIWVVTLLTAPFKWLVMSAFNLIVWIVTLPVRLIRWIFS